MAGKTGKRCSICGRRARRECPALSGLICASCCGTRRGSEIDCDPKCTSYPFGTEAYDLWLKVDSSWQKKALGYVLDMIGEDRLDSKVRELSPDTGDMEDDYMEGLSRAMLYFLTVDEDDRPAFGRAWEEEGFRGLNNDERVMTRYRIHTRPSLIEIQRVLDDKAFECVDLLDDEEKVFVVFDRSAARSLPRFSKMLVWLTDYPHFTRLAGNGITITHETCDRFIEALRDMAGDEYGERTGAAVRRYIAENFAEAHDLLIEISEEWSESLIDSVDADRCVAEYRLKVPREEVEEVLGSLPEFELEPDEDISPDDPPGTARYVWLRKGKSKRFDEMIPPGRSILDDESSGTGILAFTSLTDETFRITTMGRKKFEFAREMTDSYFGKMLEFRNENITSIRQLLEGLPEAPEPGPEKKIPRDVEEELTVRFHEDRYRRFLDEKVPMIDDMTPREAARIPAMRPKLLELMKIHINGIERINAEKGFDIDIDWVLEDLGLDELRR